MKVFVIKFKKDDTNPYVMNQGLRTNNPNLAMMFANQDLAKETALSMQYDETDIEIEEV